MRKSMWRRASAGLHDLVTADATGAQLGLMAVAEVAAGDEHDLHRHPGVEEATFVLHGGGRHLVPGGSVAQPRGTAVYIPPGEWHGFRAEQDTVLVVVYADVTTREAVPMEWLGDADPGPVPEPRIVSMESVVADTSLDQGAGFWGMDVQWLVDDEYAGARRLVLGTSVFHPDGSHDLHRHPDGEEYLFIVEGGGVHVMEDDEVRLEAGEVACIPAGEWHGYRTDDGVTTRAVFGYFGAGSLAAVGYETR